MTQTQAKNVQSKIIEEPGRGTLEIFSLDTSEEFLFKFIKDIYENYWKDICFGVLIQGAAWEVKAPNAPKRVTLLDGYITVDFGPWHFHICIGETKGLKNNPTDEALKKHRKTSRAELYRSLDKSSAPRNWGLRLYNGKDEQQMTVFLPSPFLSSEMKILKKPDWSRLACWDHLRKEYLGLQSDEKDREGKGFSHG